jgi:hypothetical protein
VGRLGGQVFGPAAYLEAEVAAGGTGVAVCDCQGVDADGKVDEEDQAPVDLGEQTAEDGTGGSGEGPAHGPVGNGARPGRLVAL